MTATSPVSWRTPVVVLIAGCLISMLTFGPRSAMGFFLAPVTTDQDWSREVFSLAIAIQNLMWGAFQPIAGGFADRYGTGRVLVAGGVFYAAGLALMAWAPTPLWLHVSAGMFIGFALSAGSFSIVIAAFGRLMPPEKRTWAIGIGTAAGSFGQFLFAPLSMVLIDSLGWRGALLTMAVLMLLVPLLAVALAGRVETSTDAGPQQGFGEAISEAFRHPPYLLLVAGFFVCGFHLAFVTVHMPAYLSGMGLAAWGGISIALIGGFNIVGAYTSGVLSGVYPKRLILSFIYLARAVAIALFVTLPISPMTVILFSAALGFLWLSTIPPTSGLVAAMFGTRYLGMLYGFVFFSHQVGSFLGVWLGGRLFDTTGSYDLVWWLGVALGVFAAVVNWPIREQAAPRLQPGIQGT